MSLQSILYHDFGLKDQEYLKTEYESAMSLSISKPKRIIFAVPGARARMSSERGLWSAVYEPSVLF
jgi:hypothetical protein